MGLFFNLPKRLSRDIDLKGKAMHGHSLCSVYATFSLCMHSSHGFFRNNDSLIMRRELTFIDWKICEFIAENIWENIILTLFIECLATEIVESYKHLAGISKEQEKHCLQKWQRISDFSHFLKMNIPNLCQRIVIIFFPE